MAFGHSRLGLENCFLENKSGRIDCVRQVYFTKSCQQSGCVSNLLYFLYITSEVKQYYEALFYHTDLRQNTEFHIFSRQIALIQYSGPPIVRVGF